LPLFLVIHLFVIGVIRSCFG